MENQLIGKYYSNLSDVIQDGIRRVLKDYEHNSEIKATAKFYQEGKITIRKASGITGIPLRGILHEFGKRGTYTRYGENELNEDIE